MNTAIDFKRLPKIELHLHLDCSLSFEVVQKLLPGTSREVYQEKFVAPGKCRNLADYIKRAVSSIEIMQDKEQLELVTADLFEQLKSDQVIYAEIRFAPLLHCQQQLSPGAVVATVEEATQKAIQRTGVQAGIILCTLRHYSAEESLATAQLAKDFQGSKVVGFDIAGNEAGFPLEPHIKAFQFARQHGIACTAHAGEACGPESVWQTLNLLKTTRIGHGVRSLEDPELVAHLKDNGIHLEVCPTSNIQTDIFENFEDHILDTIYREGLSVGVNTDGRALSDSSLADEYQRLHRHFGWQKEQFLRCNLNALEAAFIKDPFQKAALKEQLISAYRGL